MQVHLACRGNYEIIIVGKYEATSAFVALLPAQAEARLSAVVLGKLNRSARAKMLLFRIKLLRVDTRPEEII